MGALTTAGWVGLGLAAAGAVGGGISAYNSYQQGKAQERIAQYNFALAQKNASFQRQVGIAQMQATVQQARIMEAQAGINRALAQSEANARIANANQMRKTAEDQTGIDRENIRRERENFARLTARQRAAAAGSGVMESGSVLANLADTAGEMQQALNEMHYQSDIGRRKSFGEAAMEQFGGELGLAGADAAYSAGIAEAGFTRMAAQLEGAKAAAGYSLAQRQARINLMAGQSEAQGLKTGAWGSLLGAVGSFGGAVGQWTNWGQSTASTVPTLKAYSSIPSVGSRPPGIYPLAIS